MEACEEAERPCGALRVDRSLLTPKRSNILRSAGIKFRLYILPGLGAHNAFKVRERPFESCGHSSGSNGERIYYQRPLCWEVLSLKASGTAFFQNSGWLRGDGSHHGRARGGGCEAARRLLAAL